MIALLLLACGGPEPVAPSPTVPDPLPPAHGSVDPLAEAPLPEAAVPPRAWRRMDIDQLDAAIRVATGGIGWDENGESQLQDLAPTLGVPDFISTTVEDLTPGLLFQKFLDDAANAVCDELIDREAPGPAENVFLVHATVNDTFARNPAAIEDNLAYLLLRFHGRQVAPGDPAMQRWVWLYEGAEHVSGDPSVAWRTVCVGLLTHPDFYTY